MPNEANAMRSPSRQLRGAAAIAKFRNEDVRLTY
jgi:hypothetical protein